MADDRIPVLIVGGSPVGLPTAMLLGLRGTPAMVVERHGGAAIHPRATPTAARRRREKRALRDGPSSRQAVRPPSAALDDRLHGPRRGESARRRRAQLVGTGPAAV